MIHISLESYVSSMVRQNTLEVTTSGFKSWAITHRRNIEGVVVKYNFSKCHS